MISLVSSFKHCVNDSHLPPRLISLINVPTSFVKSALSTIEGFGGWVGLVAFEECADLREIAGELRGSERLIRKPVQWILQTINPVAPIPGIGDNGLIASIGDRKLLNTGIELSQAKDIFTRYVAARAFHLLRAFWCVAGRFMDAVVAVPLTVIAIGTRGNHETINEIALRALQAPGIIRDLCWCIAGVINPQSFSAFPIRYTD